MNQTIGKEPNKEKGRRQKQSFARLPECLCRRTADKSSVFAGSAARIARRFMVAAVAAVVSAAENIAASAAYYQSDYDKYPYPLIVRAVIIAASE